MGLSIRWRLTIWNTLALAIVLLGFCAIIYGLMRHALYQRIDRSLLTELQELEQKPNQDLYHWIQEAKEHQNISTVVYTSAGQINRRAEELPADSIPTMPRAERGERRFSDVTAPIVGRQRLLVSRPPLGENDFTILLMAGLEEVDHELSELLTVLAI